MLSPIMNICHVFLLKSPFRTFTSLFQKQQILHTCFRKSLNKPLRDVPFWGFLLAKNGIILFEGGRAGKKAEIEWVEI